LVTYRRLAGLFVSGGRNACQGRLKVARFWPVENCAV